MLTTFHQHSDDISENFECGDEDEEGEDECTDWVSYFPAWLFFMLYL